MVPPVHGEQDLHSDASCDEESCHVDPALQIGHDRSAVVVQATNLVPIPQVVAQVEQIDVDDAEYVPLSQAVHEVAPLDTIPFPAPISVIDPAAQVEQAEFDATVLYVLTEHAVQ